MYTDWHIHSCLRNDLQGPVETLLAHGFMKCG